MAAATVKWFKGFIPILVLVGLLLVSLYLMSEATKDSARFGELYSGLLLANAIGLLVLAGLTLCNELRDLHRDMANTKDELKRLNEARGALNERINDMEETIADALTSAAERVEALLEETGTAATAKADTQSAMPSDDSAAEDIIVPEETDTAIDENEADDAL